MDDETTASKTVDPSREPAVFHARRRRVGLTLGTAALAAGVVPILSLSSGQAQACGGLFCNRPPPDPFAPLPVAQNGENVVFAITPDPAGGAPTLEAHIQII